MKLNNLQYKVINRLSGSSDGAILVTLLEDFVAELRDMRNLKERTPEAIDANLLAGEIIERELISRLNKSLVEDSTEDSYE